MVPDFLHLMIAAGLTHHLLHLLGFPAKPLEPGRVPLLKSCWLVNSGRVAATNHCMVAWHRRKQEEPTILIHTATGWPQSMMVNNNKHLSTKQWHAVVE